MVKEVAGSPDIKGIRGNDRRKYLIDALRALPRDANYPNSETQGSCTVRPEAIDLYNKHKLHRGLGLTQLVEMPKLAKGVRKFNSNLFTQIKTI